MPAAVKPVPPMRIPTVIDTPLTPPQERFVQALARGLNISEAHREAGYKSRRNATFTLALPNVKARLAALKAETAAANRVSIDEIITRMRGIVDWMEQGSTAAEMNVARAALMDLAKICGLLTDRVEVTGAVEITEIRRILVDPRDGSETPY